VANAKKPLFVRWLLFLLIPALWCVGNHRGWLEFVENKTVDWRFRSRGELVAPIKVAYVDIDTKSLADLGNLPWDRGYYAEVCEALVKAGRAKAVGLDLVFSEKGQPDLVDRERFTAGNRKLAKFLFTQPPVVLAAAYVAAEDRDINGKPIERLVPCADADPATVQPPELPEFRVGPSLWTPPLVGLIDTIDAGTREVPLVARTSGRTYFQMAVELARLYYGAQPEDVTLVRDALTINDSSGQPLAVVPLKGGRDVEINWFTRWDSPLNMHVSFAAALASARMQDSTRAEERQTAQEFFSQFEGAVVLIGPVDPLIQDIATTSLDRVPVPRVGLHGNLLKTIITGRHLAQLPARADELITVVLALIVCGLATAGGARSARFKIFALLLIAAYVQSAFFLFTHYHLVLPLIAPLGAAFTTSFAAVGWQLICEEKQKSRIKGMFGAYLSPELVNRMVESGDDPKLGGAEVEITSFFSDIQDFSSFAELLTPQQLVELMNEYLTACTDIITAQGGTLDKYVGDAVVAMFGAPVALPDHAYRACVASQLIQLSLAELRGKWSEEGAKWPEPVIQMHTRIGMNSGLAVVGNMGSLTRFNYTMMGDNVNLAARLEGAAKTYGVGTLVTEMTKTAAEKHGDRCVFRFLDKLVVKGRKRPVAIYELAGLKDKLSRSALDCIEIFNAGIDYYLRQDWTSAADCFARAATLEPARPSSVAGLDVSTVFLKRCAAMKLTPPSKDWDGVFVLKTK